MTWALSPFQINGHPQKLVKVSEANCKKEIKKESQESGSTWTSIQVKSRDASKTENLTQADPKLLKYKYTASERVLPAANHKYTLLRKIIPWNSGPAGDLSQWRRRKFADSSLLKEDGLAMEER